MWVNKKKKLESKRGWRNKHEIESEEKRAFGRHIQIYKYTHTHTHAILTSTYNFKKITSRQEGTIWKDMQLPIESAFFFKYLRWPPHTPKNMEKKKKKKLKQKEEEEAKNIAQKKRNAPSLVFFLLFLSFPLSQ